MYALASLGLRRSAGSFCVAGAALAALQGVGCTPSATLPVGFAWQAQTCCSAKGRMYALAPLGLCRSAGGFCVAGAALGAVQGVGCTSWRPLVSGGFCVAGAALGALQGVGCTAWRPLVSATSPVGFAWQARHLLLCKGSDVRPGVPWSPLLFAWQAQHLLLCKGSDVRPGVPWSPLLLRGRRGTWCSARGRMYTLASLGLRRSAGGFCVAGADLLLCKGSDVRPGVPWSPPLCR